MPRRLTTLALVLAASAPLVLAGCGGRKPLTTVLPTVHHMEAVPRTSDSPLVNTNLVALPLEQTRDLKLTGEVVYFLSDRLRETLRQMEIGRRVYDSLGMAERDDPLGLPLMLRGTILRYAPTAQSRMGNWVRVEADVHIKFDIWHQKYPKKVVTLYASTENLEAAYRDYETSDGLPNDETNAEKLAEILVAMYERFNRDLASNNDVARLVR